MRNSRQMGTYERTLVCQRGSRKRQQAAAVRAQLVVLIYETKQEIIMDVPLNDLSAALMCCREASGHLFRGWDTGESRSCRPSRPPPCSSTPPWWCSETGRCRRSWRRPGCSSTPSSPPPRWWRPWRRPTGPGSCHLRRGGRGGVRAPAGFPFSRFPHLLVINWLPLGIVCSLFFFF